MFGKDYSSCGMRMNCWRWSQRRLNHPAVFTRGEMVVETVEKRGVRFKRHVKISRSGRRTGATSYLAHPPGPAEIHAQKHGAKKRGRDQAVTRTPSPRVLRAREARPQLEEIRNGHWVGLKGDSRSSLQSPRWQRGQGETKYSQKMEPEAWSSHHQWETGCCVAQRPLLPPSLFLIPKSEDFEFFFKGKNYSRARRMPTLSPEPGVRQETGFKWVWL